MLVKKRAAAMLLAVIMTFLLIPVTAAETTETAETAASVQYAERTEMLTALGVFTFSGKEAEAVVSRSEFAAAVADLFGWSRIPTDASVPFPFVDVKSDNPYQSKIKIMIQLGLINGVNAVEFRPNDSVTYEQAVKVLVCALGYQAFAEHRGGYPTGYMLLANQLDILLGNSVAGGTPLTWDMLVSLFTKATEAEILEIAGIGESIIYNKSVTNTLLSAYHNIYKDHGVISDNGRTAINGKTQIGTGQILIGGSKMTDATGNAKGMLGYSVDYYYRENSGDKTLLYVLKTENRNEVLVIAAESLVPGDSRFNKLQIVYEDSERPARGTAVAAISPYADFVYNGAAYAGFVADSYKIRNGRLTLIDTGNDGEYDIVVAEEYEDVLVSGINTSSDIIYSQYSDSIDFGRYDFAEFVTAAGESVQPSDIKAGSILSVFRSKDTTNIKCIVSEEKLDAMVSGIETDGEKITIQTEEAAYKLSVSLTDAIRSAGSLLKMPEVGCRYSVYLNFAGEAALLLEAVPRYEYAYALGVGTGKGLEAGIGQMKLYLETDDCLVMKTAEKISINGGAKVQGSSISTVGDFYDEGGTFVPQLVKIKRNSRDEIIELETCNTLSNAANGFVPDRFTLDYMTTKADVNGFSSASTSGDQLYSGVLKTVNGMYSYDSATKIFLIDTDLHSTVTTDETRVSVVAASELATDYLNASYMVYDADENWVAGAIVASAPSGFNGRAFIVKECKTIFDEFGEERIQADGYWKGNLWTFRESNPGVFASAVKRAGYEDGMLKPGDMLQVCFDLIDEISYAELIVSPLRSDVPFSKVLNGSNIANCVSAITFGHPVSKSEGRLGIYFGKYFVTGLQSSGSSYTLLNAHNQKLTKITAADLPIAGSCNADGTFEITDPKTMVAAYRLRGIAPDVVVVMY